MGNTTSKQTSTVFEPAASTTVSSKLTEAVESITDTDFTLDQKQLKSAHKEVARQLKAAEKAAQAKIEQGFKDIKDAKPSKNDASASELFEKLESLKKELSSRPKKGVLKDDALEARDKLVECLQKNKTQPVVCHQQFEEFKKVVGGTTAV